MKKIYYFGAIVALFSSLSVLAASTTGQALQVVESSIAIINISDLNFGTAIQGDYEKTILAGASENSENASFKVSGEPNKEYQLTLPSNSSVKMYLGGDDTLTDANKIIGVEDFTSNLDGLTPTIGASGESMIYVGATRSQLVNDQERGQYSGSFEIDVVY